MSSYFGSKEKKCIFASVTRILRCLAVLGGGGGFLQAKVLVSPGETLQVLVGGGGAGSHGEVGGAGGFNGGRNGECFAASMRVFPR